MPFLQEFSIGNVYINFRLNEIDINNINVPDPELSGPSRWARCRAHSQSIAFRIVCGRERKMD